MPSCTPTVTYIYQSLCNTLLLVHKSSLKKKTEIILNIKRKENRKYSKGHIFWYTCGQQVSESLQVYFRVTCEISFKQMCQ